MRKEEYQQLEQSYRYATPILLGCIIFAVGVVLLFINFLPKK